jgi:hypothetical protein
MGTPVFNRERAARILIDAIAFGDKTACRQWKITVRTLVRYRARLDSDPKLAELVREKGKVADAHWSKARLRFLRKGIEKLEQLIDEAKVGQLADVSDAVRTVGELDIAAQVLNGGNDPDQQGPQSPADAEDAVARADGEGKTSKP